MPGRSRFFDLPPSRDPSLGPDLPSMARGLSGPLASGKPSSRRIDQATLVRPISGLGQVK